MKAAAALAFMALVGCEPRRCLEAADPYGRYDVSVVDLYNSQSRFHYVTGQGWSYYMSQGSCGAFDGVMPGASLQLQGTGEVANTSQTCKFVTAKLSSAPAAVTLLGPSSDAGANLVARGSDNFLHAIEDVTVGTCSGVAVVELFAGGAPGGVYSAPIEGAFPPAILYRLFLPSTVSSSCSPCDDNLVIQLSKR
jgi:hypothetical protein